MKCRSTNEPAPENGAVEKSEITRTPDDGLATRRLEPFDNPTGPSVMPNCPGFGRVFSASIDGSYVTCVSTENACGINGVVLVVVIDNVTRDPVVVILSSIST